MIEAACAYAAGLVFLTTEWYWSPACWNWHAERAYAAWLRDRPLAMAVDTETTGVTWHDRAFCVTVAWEGEAHYIELDGLGRDLYLKHMLAETPLLVFHNAKFDIQKLVLAGLLDRPKLDGIGIEDTEALAHLLDEHRIKKLKVLARELLGEETNEEELLKLVRRKLKLRKEDGYEKLPRWVVAPYAVRDAEFTYRLWKVLRALLSSHRDTLVPMYEGELELTLVLLDMEAAGMATRQDYVAAKIKEYGGKVLRAEQDITRLVGREDFNPNSPKQVQEAFAHRGVRVDSTAKDVLASLDDPLAAALLGLRADSKLRSTYLLPMRDESVDGILHPNFRQHGTVTGRMSSGAASG